VREQIEADWALDAQVASLVQVNDVLRASSDTLETESLDHFLGTIVRHAVEITGAVAGSLAFPIAGSTQLEVVGPLQRDAGSGDLAPAANAERVIPLTGFAREVWEDIQNAEEHLWQPLDDPRIPQAMRGWYDDRGYRQALLVPIRLGGTTFGHLSLIFGARGRPSEAQLQVARVLAQQTAVAIRMKGLADGARQIAVARERVAQLDAANEAMRRSIERTAAAESVTAVLHSVLDECVRLVGANGGWISAVASADENPFQPLAIEVHGKRISAEEWPAASGIASVAERSLADACGFFGKVRSGEELIGPLESDDPAWWPDALAFMLRIGARQCVSLPILLRGDVVGLLTLWLPHETAPAPERIAQLRTLALQAALSLELLRFREATSKSATEAERARMAGEIHDGLAQAFLAVMMQARAAMIGGRARRGHVSQCLERIEAIAAEGLADARRSVFALRSTSIEDDGLVVALGRLVSNLSIAGGTQCVFVNRADSLDVAPAIEDAVYRIVQEATQNAIKHAGALQVKVTLDSADGKLLLSIEDDGLGLPGDVIQNARERGGLRAMQERAEHCGGTFAFEARVPRGTRVRALFPMRRKAR